MQVGKLGLNCPPLDQWLTDQRGKKKINQAAFTGFTAFSFPFSELFLTCLVGPASRLPSGDRHVYINCQTWWKHNMARPLLAAHPLPPHSPSPTRVASCALQHFKSLLRPLSSSPSKKKIKPGLRWKVLTIAVSAVVGSANGPFLSPPSLTEVARDETTLSQLCRVPLLVHQLEPHVLFLCGPRPLRHPGSCSSARAKLIFATGRLNFKRICKWASLWHGILMLPEGPDVISSCLKQKKPTLLLFDTMLCFVSKHFNP